MIEDHTLESYVKNAEKKEKLYRRTLIIVTISQLFGGAGVGAGLTVATLLVQDMFDSEVLIGLPLSLFPLGSALAAFLIGYVSQRRGRRTGLAAGFIAGGIGSSGVIAAAIMDSTVLLLISFFICGAGTATTLLARYAGTDLAEKHQRATAVSIALIGTMFGAVAGPNLTELMGGFARMIGLPLLVGPFILGAATFLVAGLILFIFLRPDPFKVAQALEMERQKLKPADGIKRTANDKRGIVLAALIMVVTQFVMVAVMIMTPIHMGGHGHDLGAIGMVIGIHVACMYLPSVFSGILIDKVGKEKMTIAATVIIFLSGLLAAVAPEGSLLIMIISLGLLGIGWNLGLISGTTILIDATATETRAKTQGTVDVLLALAAATGGILGGIVVATAGFGLMSVAGGVLALCLIPALYFIKSDKDNQPN